jgi:quinol monooxygenase YgiN
VVLVNRPISGDYSGMETSTESWPIVELRRYTLHPGRRETLIALFDRELVETQEACGMQVIAQFRDIDNPDVFTWLRGFADMESRKAALTTFYDGPAWCAHRDTANATMIDSDNVRLLRPANPASGLEFAAAARPSVGATSIPPGLTVATIYTIAPHARAGFAGFFDRVVAPEMIASGARPCAAFETEPSGNTFPRLPVREREHTFVWFAQFADVAAYDRHVPDLHASHEWNERKQRLLERHFSAPAERWRLTPTARSLPLACSDRYVTAALAERWRRDR